MKICILIKGMCRQATIQNISDACEQYLIKLRYHKHIMEFIKESRNHLNLISLRIL